MIEATDIFDNAELAEQFSLSFAKMDKLEVIQLLSDLDYVRASAFEDGVIDDQELGQAISQFRYEIKESLRQANEQMLDFALVLPTSFPEPVNGSSDGQLTDQELSFLKEITGLDRELQIKRLPTGICSLYSRVILYRYRVYGLSSRVAGCLLNDTIIAELDAERVKFGFDGDYIGFSNMLADQEALTRHCISSSFFDKQLEGTCAFFAVVSDEGRDVIDNLGGKIQRNLRFLKILKDSPFRSVPKGLIDSLDRDQVKLQTQLLIDANYKNQFMLRVLQVKLWVLGLYQENLDDYFGPKSIAALAELLESIVESDEDGAKELGRILYNLGTDQCIVNIRYMFHEHLLAMETSALQPEQSSLSKVYEFVLEDKTSLSSLNSSQKDEIREKANLLNEKLENQLKNESSKVLDPNKKNTRHYKARKGILRLVSKLWKWVSNSFKKIIKLFKRLLQLVMKAVKHLYLEVKEAFQQFSKGMKFLFGKRIISTDGAISTDFDIDFDGMTKISPDVSREQIQAHMDSLKDHAQSIYPSLTFVRLVIQWGLSIATGPVGWAKILLGMAQIFRELIVSKTSWTARPV